jgi:hypothetical protein
MEKEQFVFLNVKIFEEKLRAGYERITEVMRQNELDYPVEFECWAFAVMGQVVEKMALGVLQNRIQVCEYLENFIVASVRSPLDGMVWLAPYWGKHSDASR